MITLKVDENNPLTQNSYDDLIFNLPLHCLQCPKCKLSGNLSTHAYYVRFLKTTEGTKTPLRICRVICNSCNATHALLPSKIVPYSQIDINTHVGIIDAYEKGLSFASMEVKFAISMYCIKYLIYSYQKSWREMLKCAAIKLDSLDALVLQSFSHYSIQFMQIKNPSNTLFVNTT